MYSSDISLPPPDAVQSALRRVTETLAAELASPSERPPSWSEFEWCAAQAVAAMHGVASLLASTQRWHAPADWRCFLDEQRAHTVARHRRIETLLGDIDRLGRARELPLIALKGAALSRLGLYATGERPMADLDLLVRPTDLDRAAQVLEQLAFHDAGTTWKHRAFEPSTPSNAAGLGEHSDNPVKVDLHIKIAERLPLPETNISDLVFPGRLQPGLNDYPSLASLMLHVLAHAAGTMVHRGLRLIQLVDVARIARRMTDGDWQELVKYHGSDHRLWWAHAPLIVTARYFPTAIPASVMDALRRDCPWLLRRVSARRLLSDVSYSHVFIDPIPGIVWTRSLGEMFRYLAYRANPGREQREQLDLLARTYPWAADPQWYEQSQKRRILRWLISRPTRTETMRPIRAALASRH